MASAVVLLRLHRDRVGAIVALRSVIQSVRQTFAGEARSLITGDAIIASNQAVEAGIDREDRSASERGGRGKHPSIELATMTRPADRPMAAPGWSSFAPSSARFPTTADEARRRSVRIATRCSKTSECSCVRNLLAQSDVKGRRCADDRIDTVHHSRRHRLGAGPAARGLQHRPAGVRGPCRPREDGSYGFRQPCRDAAPSQGA
jgi:hypothetical protein